MIQNELTIQKKYGKIFQNELYSEDMQMEKDEVLANLYTLRAGMSVASLKKDEIEKTEKLLSLKGEDIQKEKNRHTDAQKVIYDNIEQIKKEMALPKAKKKIPFIVIIVDIIFGVMLCKILFDSFSKIFNVFFDCMYAMGEDADPKADFVIAMIISSVFILLCGGMGCTLQLMLYLLN